MQFDTHMHTRFSTDSTMAIEDAIKRGQELNMGIIITEHMDLAYPEPEAFIFDVDEYLKTYNKYRSSKVLLGVEVGMRTDCCDENQSLVAKHPFDFVIGSIHVIENIDIYNASFYHERSIREVYNQYFDSMLACLNTYDFIDSLGHIDYICRYAKYDDPEIYYQDFCERLDQILSLVAQKGKAMEINTRRLDNKTTVEALTKIYKRFYELGGRLVTIGSDAHKPEDIGRNIDVARHIAESCKLKPVWYCQRQPQYVK